jgi:hypothetical protein
MGHEPPTSDALQAKRIICVILSAIILTLLAPGFGTMAAVIIMGGEDIFTKVGWAALGDLLHPQWLLVYLSSPVSFVVVLGGTIISGLVIVHVPKARWALAVLAGALTGMAGSATIAPMAVPAGAAAGAILGALFLPLYGLLMRLPLPIRP